MDHTNVSRDRWNDHWLFLTHFRKSPRTVGAIAPSSQQLARRMLDGLELTAGTRLVELGPGTGAITGEIDRRLPESASCLAIDIDPVFSARVGVRWPRIVSVCDRAERLAEIAGSRDLLPVDHIVSGLPFVSLPPTMTREILSNVSSVLRPGGTFTTFQYLHGYGLPPAVNFRRSMTAHMTAAPSVRLVLRNLPPALVLTWKKG